MKVVEFFEFVPRAIAGTALAAVIAGAVGISGAKAADYGTPPPPPPPAPEIRTHSSSQSCLYVAADVGAAIHERPNVSKGLSALFLGFGGPGGGSNAVDEELDDSVIVDFGIGCQIMENLRAELTGGLRLKQSLHDPYGTLEANMESYTGFVNFYYDITNYAGWTPYIGAGIGAVYHRVFDISAPADTTEGTNVNFAWNLQLGVAYDITPNLKVDAGYRYIDLGRALANGGDRMLVSNIVAHEFKLGMRYHFNGW